MNDTLTFRTSSHASLPVRVTGLTARPAQQGASCTLTGRVDLKTWQRIERAEAFNLRADILGAPSAAFAPGHEIELRLLLQPELAGELLELAGDPDEVLAVLKKASKKDPSLLADNWLCQSVEQPDAPGKPGFRTFWSYVDLGELTSGKTDEQILGAFSRFMKDTRPGDPNLPMVDETLELIREVFEDLMEPEEEEASGSSGNGRSAQAAPAAEREGGGLFPIVATFLRQSGLNFEEMDPGRVLRISCKGRNGQWVCLAKIEEADQQFLFYSICPANVPPPRRLAMAEFLTRANYGMLMGNFEMDFGDGEVRFKTGIDVEGSGLDTALVRRLVYTNIQTMDQYLPGILEVVQGQSPEAALAGVEG